MAITDSQKIDYLFKKVGYNITKTDTSTVKSPSNESIPSPLLIRGDVIWQQSGSIPASIPVANTSVVSLYNDTLHSTIQATNDNTVSTNRTWKTGLTDWIDSSFGSSYQIKVYIAPTGNTSPQTYGTQIFPDGTGVGDEWFFDYQSGVLNFSGNVLPSVSFTGNSVYISGARYAGTKGITAFGNLNLVNASIVTSGIYSNLYINANSNISISSTYGGISFNSNTGYINVGNSIVTGALNPVNPTDLVTLSYLNSITSGSANIITQGDSFVSVVDPGTNAKILITTDGNLIANLSTSLSTFYNTTNIGNLSFTSNTISSSNDIILTPYGNGVVQVTGTSAISLPNGSNLNRPVSPTSGALRYNSDSASLEFWNGTNWVSTNHLITSQIIIPDGINTSYSLSNSSDTNGVLVSINGTVQRPVTSYNVTGNVITFSEILPITDIVEIRNISSGLVSQHGISSNGTALDIINGNVILQNGNLNVNNGIISSNIQGVILTSSQPNITSVGNLTSLSASGTIQTTGIVYGNSGVSGTLLTPAQTNITSLGNLTVLSVGGTSSHWGAATFYNGITGTLSTASQPNITGVGTITSGTWSGSFGAVSGANLTSLTASNLSGTIPSAVLGNSTHYIGTTAIALNRVSASQSLTGISIDGSAATVTGATQSNITSVGTLTGLTVGGITNVTNTTQSTAFNNGALIVSGGLGVAKDVYIQGNLYVANVVSTTTQTLTVQDPLIYLTANTAFPYNYDIGFYSHFIGGPANTYVHTGVVRNDSDGKWYFFSNIPEPAGGQVDVANVNVVYDSIVSGAHTVYGAITGNANVAQNLGSTSTWWNNTYTNSLYSSSIYGILQTAAQPNITSVGNLSSLSSSGTIQTTGIVYGNSGISGTLLTASQPNITGVGTITSGIWSGSFGAVSGANLTSLTAGNLSGTIPSAVLGNSTLYVGTTAIALNRASASQSLTGISIDGSAATVTGAAQSNITSVGTLSSLSVSGAITVNSGNNATAIVNGGTNGSGNIGSSTVGFNTVFAKATTAQYADLAENYTSDNVYKPGTVVVFGGEKEITTTTISHDTKVAGVISENPAYLMNSELQGLPVAFTGRVKCYVHGPIQKGDVLVTSDILGVAQKIDNLKFLPGCVLGKSLENILGQTIELIEVVVGRF